LGSIEEEGIRLEGVKKPGESRRGEKLGVYKKAIAGVRKKGGTKFWGLQMSQKGHEERVISGVGPRERHKVGHVAEEKKDSTGGGGVFLGTNEGGADQNRTRRE